MTPLTLKSEDGIVEFPPYNPTEGNGKGATPPPFLSVEYKGICMTIKQDYLRNTEKLSNKWGSPQF